MIFIWLLMAAAAVAFAVSMFWGAPYLPTQKAQVQMALDLLDLKAGQVLYDLGCGDGRLLRAAARRGIKATGYELNPFLFAIGWVLNLRYRKLAKIKLGNFWQADIADADGVYIFLLDKFMPRLNQFMKSQKSTRPVKLASYTFQIPGQKPAKTSGPIFLYKY